MQVVAAALRPAVRRAIIAHAREDAPNECCGFLVGRGRDVIAAVRLRNVVKSPTRFRVDPREHIEVRRMLRRFEPPLDIVGLYHSHPASAPIPSPTDLAEAHYREWLYVIVGLAGPRPRIRAWRAER